MKRHTLPALSRFPALYGLLLLLAAPAFVEGEPQAAAVSGFDAYIHAVEARLARQHGAVEGFLVPENESRLRQGELLVERVVPAAEPELPGAMLHHWRGTAFVAGGTVADFERLMKDFKDYPVHFAPEVLKAGSTERQDGHLAAWMRVRQKHVIAVVMDTRYDVSFARLDARHGSSVSRSTKVTEIAAAGTSEEHALGPGDEHGFLWRINTYWSYEERDGGLYMQIESVSLTRSIPAGLGWAVKPFVESVPRESLEFTLRSAGKGLRR